MFGWRAGLAGAVAIALLTAGTAKAQPQDRQMGGIGITVFRCMLCYIAEEHLAHRVTLIYSNRDRESTAFLDELRPAPGEAYARVEGPRGELGFYVVSDGGPAPARAYIEELLPDVLEGRIEPGRVFARCSRVRYASSAGRSSAMSSTCPPTIPTAPAARARRETSSARRGSCSTSASRAGCARG